MRLLPALQLQRFHVPGRVQSRSRRFNGRVVYPGSPLQRSRVIFFWIRNPTLTNHRVSFFKKNPLIILRGFQFECKNIAWFWWTLKVYCPFRNSRLPPSSYENFKTYWNTVVKLERPRGSFDVVVKRGRVALLRHAACCAPLYDAHLLIPGEFFWKMFFAPSAKMVHLIESVAIGWPRCWFILTRPWRLGGQAKRNV